MKNKALPILLSGFCLLALPSHCRAEPDPSAQAAEIRPGETSQNLQELGDPLSQGRAVPHFENGQPDDYRTYDPNTPETALQNGEAVRAIDGETPNDPPHAFQMLDSGVLTNHRIDTITESEEGSSDEAAGE